MAGLKASSRFGHMLPFPLFLFLFCCARSEQFETSHISPAVLTIIGLLTIQTEVPCLRVACELFWSFSCRKLVAGFGR
ncbi:hypothetical protein C4D60_Mb03t12490 [Musa balbisiana]|uniref:Secreted protein n=1 Tax=Musa balbisiana TaxID=52838 RepID=A0A4S8J9D3_MUSBA|nr:hypothetical protein C4D60_Mb03t12490 [Musa balbisiana]